MLCRRPNTGEDEHHAIQRLYNRDIQRVADEPIGVAVGVDTDGKQTPLRCSCPKGVNAYSVIFTLLYYLRERLIYRLGVFHMEGRVGLHQEASWHVTPQTENLNQQDMVQCQRVHVETSCWLDS